MSKETTAEKEPGKLDRQLKKLVRLLARRDAERDYNREDLEKNPKYT